MKSRKEKDSEKEAKYHLIAPLPALGAALSPRSGRLLDVVRRNPTFVVLSRLGKEWGRLDQLWRIGLATLGDGNDAGKPGIVNKVSGVSDRDGEYEVQE